MSGLQKKKSFDSDEDQQQLQSVSSRSDNSQDSIKRPRKQKRKLSIVNISSPKNNSNFQINQQEKDQQGNLLDEEEVIKQEQQTVDVEAEKINDSETSIISNIDCIELVLQPYQKKVHLEKNFKQTLMVNLQLQSQLVNRLGKTDKPSIDLVCVVDISGSMSGQKLELVRDSLRYLTKILGEKDRIAIVKFEGHSTFVMPWTLNNAENKSSIKKKIKSLKSAGSTNISSGVDKGLFLIKNRKWRNPVCSMFLLSDGQDDTKGADNRVQNLLIQHDIKDTFMINSFGFGNDHDATVMNNIANFKNGNFQFIEHINKVAEYFILSMSGMLSVLAKQVTIRINECQKDQGYQIEKLYGENKIWLQNSQKQWETSINYLVNGSNKNFVFEISLPKRNPKVVINENYENVIELYSSVSQKDQMQNLKRNSKRPVNQNQNL